jgi:MFS family permease
VSQLERERGAAAGVVKQSVLSGLTDVRSLLLMVAYFFLNVAIYAIAIWTPDIVQLASQDGIVDTGYLISFLWAVILVAMIFNGWHSDRTGERFKHVIVPLSLGIAGSLIAMSFQSDFLLLYAGLIVIGIGTQAGYLCCGASRRAT